MESAEFNALQYLLPELTALASSDDSSVVRLYLASAAQKIASEHCWALIEALASHSVDATDHNLPLMYWYAAEPLAYLDATRALALAMSAGESIPLLREFMLRRFGSSDTGSSLGVLVKGLGEAQNLSLQLTFMKAIRAALRGQRQVSAPADWARVSSVLLQSKDQAVGLQTTALGVTFVDPAELSQMRTRITDQSEQEDDRLVALQLLLDANHQGLAPTLQSLLTAHASLHEAAIQGLAQYNDRSVAPALPAKYSEFTPDQRRKSLGTLCSRSHSGVALLKAVDHEQVPGTDLTADLVRQLQFLKNDQVNSLRKNVWGTVRETTTDELAMISQYRELVASDAHPAANAERGPAVFAKTCMKCHILYGKGNRIGPDGIKPLDHRIPS